MAAVVTWRRTAGRRQWAHRQQQVAGRGFIRAAGCLSLALDLEPLPSLITFPRCPSLPGLQELGVQILSDLQRQRETILHSRDTLHTVRAAAGWAWVVLPGALTHGRDQPVYPAASFACWLLHTSSGHLACPAWTCPP